MKKCPECGNPSYDGAPVCGNCGYNFPKPKTAVRSEDIFQKEPKSKETSNEESTINIIKQNKLVIGIILLITLIVICGIVLMGSNDNNNNTSAIQTSEFADYSAGDFSFKYPGSWKETNLTDAEHENAKFFDAGNGVEVEYYNVSNDSPSIKDITQTRLSTAQGSGDYVELVDTISLNAGNASNVITESTSGDYTRFVSILNNGELHVLKITGNSYDSVTSEDIENVVQSITLS